jgi:GntR family transcriptional repressor for pyruvate dehydrogenase complex
LCSGNSRRSKIIEPKGRAAAAEESGAASANRQPSLVERVYQQLFRLISRGEYAPGSKLPSENELATTFDVSRPIVRDALQRLRDQGLVSSRQGAGSFVRERPTERFLKFAPVESLADIQRCYEFRETIEPAAAHLAAQRRDAATLGEIERCLRRLGKATASRLHRDDVDFEFHLAIAKAANNHFYTAALTALREQVAVGMRLHGLSLLGPSEKLEQPYQEHSEIFEAIKAGDAAKAERIMRRHLANSRERLFGGAAVDLRL